VGDRRTDREGNEHYHLHLVDHGHDCAVDRVRDRAPAMSDPPTVVQLDPQFISPPAADDLRRLREAVGTSSPETAAALERIVAFNETMRVALGGQIGPALYEMHSDLRSQFLSLQRLVEKLIDHAQKLFYARITPSWVEPKRRKTKSKTKSKPKKKRRKKQI
jgi:hypothetical protein